MSAPELSPEERAVVERFENARDPYELTREEYWTEVARMLNSRNLTAFPPLVFRGMVAGYLAAEVDG